MSLFESLMNSNNPDSTGGDYNVQQSSQPSLQSYDSQQLNNQQQLQYQHQQYQLNNNNNNNINNNTNNSSTQSTGINFTSLLNNTPYSYSSGSSDGDRYSPPTIVGTTSTNAHGSDDFQHNHPTLESSTFVTHNLDSYLTSPVPSSPSIFSPSSPSMSTTSIISNNNSNNHGDDNIFKLFASYSPSPELIRSPYIFHVTPSYYAAKKNQKIGVFLYQKSESNRLCVQHPQLKLRLQSVAPYWTPSSFTRKDNKKNIDSIAPTQFESIETTMKKGEALFGPVRIQKTGFYFLRCSVELPPIPTEEDLKFKDISFSFKIYFYGSPSKKKDKSDSEQPATPPTTSSTTASVNSNDEPLPTSLSNINIRPNENLMNYISHLQETGARWKDLENVFDIYFKKYEKNPEVLSDLFVEQSIGSTFIGNLHDAHMQMDKGIETFYSPENLFKISYLKSAIFRIQKNYTASKLHLDACDFLYKKIELSNLHQGQYYFNKAAHDYDCFVTQKTKQNNYTQVRDQIVEKFKMAADFYAKDYENLSPNATTNARSINGTYRSNIRITQTILGSTNLTKNDLDRAESYLAKIPNIQSYTFTQRTQIHLLFTWADLMLSKSYHLFRTNNNLSFQMLAQSLEFINKSSTYASRLGFKNEIRYTTDRYQKLYSIAPKSFVNTLNGTNLLGNHNNFFTQPNNAINNLQLQQQQQIQQTSQFSIPTINNNNNDALNFAQALTTGGNNNNNSLGNGNNLNLNSSLVNLLANNSNLDSTLYNSILNSSINPNSNSNNNNNNINSINTISTLLNLLSGNININPNLLNNLLLLNSLNNLTQQQQQQQQPQQQSQQNLLNWQPNNLQNVNTQTLGNNNNNLVINNLIDNNSNNNNNNNNSNNNNNNSGNNNNLWNQVLINTQPLSTTVNSNLLNSIIKPNNNNQSTSTTLNNSELLLFMNNQNNNNNSSNSTNNNNGNSNDLFDQLIDNNNNNNQYYYQQ